MDDKTKKAFGIGGIVLLTSIVLAVARKATVSAAPVPIPPGSTYLTIKVKNTDALKNLPPGQAGPGAPNIIQNRTLVWFIAVLPNDESDLIDLGNNGDLAVNESAGPNNWTLSSRRVDIVNCLRTWAKQMKIVISVSRWIYWGGDTNSPALQELYYARSTTQVFASGKYIEQYISGPGTYEYDVATDTMRKIS